MQWIIDNLPIVSSALVAISSVFISVIKLFKENDANTKKIKRLVDLSDIYIKLPNEAKAKGDINEILKIEADKFKMILTRKMNLSNLAAVIVVSIIGGFLSYFLALWATNSWIVWSIIAWILFSIVAFFTIGIAIVGLASVYEPDDKKEKKK